LEENGNTGQGKGGVVWGVLVSVGIVYIPTSGRCPARCLFFSYTKHGTDNKKKKAARHCRYYKLTIITGIEVMQHVISSGY